MSIRHLEQLLMPGSVAVIGASDRPGRIGTAVWRRLAQGGFGGPIWPVNRRLHQLGAHAVLADVGALPQPPDLALICTPPDTVPGLIERLGRMGTRAAIVLTPDLTPRQQAAMLAAARPQLLRILGPGSLGMASPHQGLNAACTHADAIPGELAFVSQSGALLGAVLDWARSRGIGFSRLVDLGASADVDLGDLIDWLASDARTRAILLHVESLHEARKFMSAARAAARNKPVIVVRTGRGAAEPAGAPAPDARPAAPGRHRSFADRVFDAAVCRAGMLRVDTLGELFMAAETLAHFGRSRSPSLFVIGNGRGPVQLAADAASTAGVPLAQPSPAVLEALARAWPEGRPHGNPLDLGGEAPPERHAAALLAVLEAPTGADGPPAVLLLHAPSGLTQGDDVARACLPLASAHRDRVQTCWLGGEAADRARRLFSGAGLADYPTPEGAVRALALLGTYRRNQRQLLEVPPATPPVEPDRAALRRIVDTARATGGGWLPADAVWSLLAASRVPTLPSRLVPLDAEAAVEAASELGWPVALKLRSPDLPRKSIAGAVMLGLADPPALRSAAEAMRARLRRERPDARLDGFLVQAMLNRPGLQELAIGTNLDPVFGPVLRLGPRGSVSREGRAPGEAVAALPPLNGVLAGDLIARSALAQRLEGGDGQPRCDRAAIEQVLVAVSQLLADCPELVELEIDPLAASADGAWVLDARIRLDPRAPGGAARFAIRPYPDQLEQRLDWGGRAILIRPVRPDDGERHAAFAARLSSDDLRLRFFQTLRTLPRSEIARLTQIDYEREMALLAIDPAGVDGPEVLGVARAVADPDGVEAEYAVVVRSDLHRGGLGRLLMEALIRYCRSRGLQRLVGYVLRDNPSMLGLSQRLGFVIDAAESDAEVVRMHLPLHNT